MRIFTILILTLFVAAVAVVPKAEEYFTNQLVNFWPVRGKNVKVELSNEAGKDEDMSCFKLRESMIMSDQIPSGSPGKVITYEYFCISSHIAELISEQLCTRAISENGITEAFNRKLKEQLEIKE